MRQVSHAMLHSKEADQLFASSVLHIPSSMSSAFARAMLQSWFWLATSTSMVDTAAHNMRSVQKNEGYVQ